MNLLLALAAFVGLCLAPAASTADMFGFKITHPKEGWIGSADGELRFFPGPVRPGTPEYLVWSASSKTDAVQIWREPVRDDLKKKFLAINPTANEFQLQLQTESAATWKWVSAGKRADANIAHLEVAEGKFKGRFLGIEDVAIEFTPKDGRKARTVHKLKLVEKQEDSLKFTVYVVAP